MSLFLFILPAYSLLTFHFKIAIKWPRYVKRWSRWGWDLPASTTSRAFGCPPPSLHSTNFSNPVWWSLPRSSLTGCSRSSWTGWNRALMMSPCHWLASRAYNFDPDIGKRRERLQIVFSRMLCIFNLWFCFLVSIPTPPSKLGEHSY